MVVRVLPEARNDLRDAIRHYRAVQPPAVGKQLAARVFVAFKDAIASTARIEAFCGAAGVTESAAVEAALRAPPLPRQVRGHDAVAAQARPPGTRARAHPA